jgi:hypothetical protein
VVRDRWDAEQLEDHKLPYAQERPPAATLLEAVQAAQPTVLIGLSDGDPPHAFSREVCLGGGGGADGLSARCACMAPVPADAARCEWAP